MRFSLFTTALGLVAGAFAQTADFASITAPGSSDVVEAGTTTTIKWTARGAYTGPVKLIIIGGPKQAELNEVSNAGTVDYKAGKFDWAVDKKLGKDKVYGVKMILESDETIFQFSQPFSIKPAAGGSTDSTTGTGSATATGSSKTTGSATATTTSAPTSADNSTVTAPTGPSTIRVTRTNPATSSTPTSTPGVATGAASTIRVATFAALGGLAGLFFTL